MSALKYQTFGPRVAASIADGLIFLPLPFLDYLVFEQLRLSWLTVAWLVISYSAVWLYVVLMHGFYGQTLGKRFFKIRVVDNATEGPITMFQAFIRESVLITINLLSLVIDLYVYLNGDPSAAQMFYTASIVLSYATVTWFVLEIVTCLFNRKRRALHDFLGGTVVIKTDDVYQVDVNGAG